MNYYGTFGLEYNPFLKNTKNVLVETEDWGEVKRRLDYLMDSRGFGLITGLPGRGKTTCVRNWADSLNRNSSKVVYLSLSTVTCLEFYKQLAQGLGIEYKHRKHQNFRLIQDEITRLSLEKKVTPVIILDEAHYIMSSILNDLKMIFNFEMDTRDRAVLLLVGSPQINNTLRLSTHESLKQRLSVNYCIHGLNRQEAAGYIDEKIKKAGGEPRDIITHEAMEAIINSGNGIPRIINRICDGCLKIASARRQRDIDAETVMLAVNEMELD